MGEQERENIKKRSEYGQKDYTAKTTDDIRAAEKQSGFNISQIQAKGLTEKANITEQGKQTGINIGKQGDVDVENIKQKGLTDKANIEAQGFQTREGYKTMGEVERENIKTRSEYGQKDYTQKTTDDIRAGKSLSENTVTEIGARSTANVSEIRARGAEERAALALRDRFLQNSELRANSRARNFSRSF